MAVIVFIILWIGSGVLFEYVNLLDWIISAVFWGFMLLMFDLSSIDKTPDKSVNHKASANKTSVAKIKVKRSDCVELLTSKGYMLYRGLNMIYSVTPIGGFDNDAVFRSRNLNQIYEFALQAKNINSTKNDLDSNE